MESLTEVYDGCYRRLVGQLYALCGSLSEAEDAVQEAFVRAIEKPRRFEQLENPEAWLRMVALNIARSRFRRISTLHRIISRTGPPADAVPGLTPDHVALVDVLRHLPWDQREVITLYHIVDLPVREIAAQLGVPQGTVKARLSRGRSRLAPLVREFAEEVDHV
jgi:RNA polymerase sigma factor (sigma-70 family)